MATTTCPACTGAGKLQNTVTGKQVTCPLCNGSGTISSTGMGDLVFDYVFSPPQLTADQAGVAALVNISNDYDFEVTEIKASSTGLFSVQLTDQFRNTVIHRAHQWREFCGHRATAAGAVQAVAAAAHFDGAGQLYGSLRRGQHHPARAGRV